jgi:hypothetical protein
LHIITGTNCSLAGSRKPKEAENALFEAVGWSQRNALSYFRLVWSALSGFLRRQCAQLGSG